MNKTNLTNKEMVRMRIFLERLEKSHYNDLRFQFRLPNKFWSSLNYKQQKKYRDSMRDNDSQIRMIKSIIIKLKKWEDKADLGLNYDKGIELWVDE